MSLLWLALAIALGCGALALGFGIEQDGLVRFLILLNLILVVGALLFMIRRHIRQQRTRQLLQFAYIALGAALALAGILGMLNPGWWLTLIYLCMLLIPGAALVWTGVRFSTGTKETNE